MSLNHVLSEGTGTLPKTIWYENSDGSPVIFGAMALPISAVQAQKFVDDLEHHGFIAWYESE